MYIRITRLNIHLYVCNYYWGKYISYTHFVGVSVS